MSGLAKTMKQLRQRRKETNSDKLLTSQVRTNNNWYANAGSMGSERQSTSPYIRLIDLMVSNPKEIVLSIDHNNVETEKAEYQAQELSASISKHYPDVKVSLHSGKVDIAHFRDVDVVIDVQNFTFVILKAKGHVLQDRTLLISCLD
jgi:hypothetical protein